MLLLQALCDLYDLLKVFKLPSSAAGGARAAVVEEADGRLSYWALRHPPGRPDLHHADAFALRLTSRDAGESGDLAVGLAP